MPGLTEKDITPVLLQHPDGKTALHSRRRRCLGRARSHDGAGRSGGRREAVLPQAEANTWGILNVREEFLKDHPDLVRRVLGVYEAARKHSLANYDDVKRVFIAATKLPEAVVDKQLKERTELTHSRIGAPQKESILAAGLALAAGGRDQGRRRREGDGREPDRRPLGGGDELALRVPHAGEHPSKMRADAREGLLVRDTATQSPASRICEAAGGAASPAGHAAPHCIRVIPCLFSP